MISPLLANLYLHDLDVKLAGLVRALCRDFVILCRPQRKRPAWRWALVAAEGLQLHPDKALGDAGCGPRLEFLGYRFETGRRWVATRA
ncbi:MAG: hypothetical protein IPK27_13390 [Rhodanobacteraceae bacterium]|nr:hypothetical protein [Rhodanobacteraceae bacterium]